MNKPINIKQCIEFTSNNFTRSFYIVFYCFIRFSSLLIPKQWFNNKIDIYSLIISFKLLQKVILNHIINNILMVYIIGLALGHVVYEKHIMIKIISHKYQPITFQILFLDRISDCMRECYTIYGLSFCLSTLSWLNNQIA